MQRTEQIPTVSYSPTLYFFFGAGSLGLFIAFIVLLKKIQDQRSRPVLIFWDHSTDQRYYFGYYLGKVRFSLQSIKGKVKYFWAVQCKIEGQGSRFIIPSHGEFEDVVKKDDDIPFVVHMEGKMLGSGELGAEVHREWAESAFPKSVYGFDQIGEIPPNYWLCIPHWSVGYKKEVFQEDANRMTNMFTLLHQLQIDRQAEIEIVFEKFEGLLSTNFQTQTSHFFSHWESVLAAWDGLLKQYTTSIFTIGRLLHIRSDQVAMAGINQAISQGSIPAVAEFIRGYRGMMDDVWESMGYVGLPKDTLEMTFQKANKTKEEAMMLAQKNDQLTNQIQGLISQMRQGVNAYPQETDINM